MPLAQLILAVMMAWVDPRTHRYYEKPEATNARYASIAEDIAEVVLSPDEQPALPLAPGTDDVTARIRAGLLLASIAAYESAFHAADDQCKRPGRGHAWSIFQMQRGRAIGCGKRVQVVRAAFSMVRASFALCRHLPITDRLGFYTDGRCERGSWRSSSRVRRAMRWKIPPSLVESIRADGRRPGVSATVTNTATESESDLGLRKGKGTAFVRDFGTARHLSNEAGHGVVDRLKSRSVEKETESFGLRDEDGVVGGDAVAAEGTAPVREARRDLREGGAARPD